VGPSSERQDSEQVLRQAFTNVAVFHGDEAGLPSYELLVVASALRRISR